MDEQKLYYAGFTLTREESVWWMAMIVMLIYESGEDVRLKCEGLKKEFNDRFFPWGDATEMNTG